MSHPPLVLLLCLLLPLALCLTREELIDHLKSEQETAGTFDARVPRLIRPLGYVAGEPIWPRILERAKSPADIFFDDDNFAYHLPRKDVAALVRKIDRQENFEKVLKFLQKYS